VFERARARQLYESLQPHHALKPRSIELISAKDLLRFVCAGHTKLSQRDAGLSGGADAGVGAAGDMMVAGCGW
jgi:hypothetical protein